MQLPLDWGNIEEYRGFQIIPLKEIINEKQIYIYFNLLYQSKYIFQFFKYNI